LVLKNSEDIKFSFEGNPISWHVIEEMWTLNTYISFNQNSSSVKLSFCQGLILSVRVDLIC